MSEQATVIEQEEATIGGDQFKDMLKVLSSIVDEVLVKIDKDGINVVCVDPAHISMYQVVAPKEAFSTWQVTGNIEVGLDCEKMLKAMARCHMSPIKVKMTAKKVVLSTSSKRFTLSTIDTTGMTVPKIPTLNLSTEFELGKDALTDAVKDAGWMADHIRIEVRGGMLYVSAQGDLTNYEQPIGKVVSGDVRSCFPLDYLEKFSKVCGKKVKVKMANDYPIRFDWQTDDYDYKGELRQRGISYTFLLAPRIESEDDQPSKPVKPVKEPTPEPEDVEPEYEAEDSEDYCDEEAEDYCDAEEEVEADT